MTVARLVQELRKLHPRATAYVETADGVLFVVGILVGDEVVAPKQDAYLLTSSTLPRGRRPARRTAGATRRS